MTNAQKAQFLELAAQNLDLLKAFYRDVQWKYFGRIFTDAAVLPAAILDSLSGVPEAVRESLRIAGISMAWLTEYAPLVPNGGPPHGTPENWAVVWVDLATSTETMLRTAAQTLSRTSAFNAMIESWRRFADAIRKALGGAGAAATSLGGAAMVIGALLIIRELRSKR